MRLARSDGFSQGDMARLQRNEISAQSSRINKNGPGNERELGISPEGIAYPKTEIPYGCRRVCRGGDVNL